MKKKSKKIAGKNWHCSVSYNATSNDELRKELEGEIKRRTDFMVLLKERNQAERRVNVVRLKITNSCIRLMNKGIRDCEKKLKALEQYSKLDSKKG